MQYCIVATNNGYFLSTADELHSSNSLAHHGIKGQRWYLLTEYAYYLADPEQYWQDRDKYLKDY